MMEEHPRSQMLIKEPRHVTNDLPTPDILTVYGASWCGDCANARRFLDSVGAEYRYVDLGQDLAAQRLLDDAGYRAIPIVVTPSGAVLVDPSQQELAQAIGVAAA
jgi:mycoredoxin